MGKYPIPRSLNHFKPLSTRIPNIGHFRILPIGEVQTESELPRALKLGEKKRTQSKQNNTFRRNQMLRFMFNGMLQDVVHRIPALELPGLQAIGLQNKPPS